MHRFFIIFLIVILTSINGFLFYAHEFLSLAQWEELSAESGYFERLTAITFGIVAIGAFIIYWSRKVSLWLYFSILMLLACMRELDLHKEWTTDSILKSNFYESASVPVTEKIIGAGIIVLLLFLAFQLVKRVPYWLKSLWQFRAQAWAIGFGLGALVIAKSIDSMARWFPFMAEFKAENGAFLGVIEESLEFAGALFFLSVCLMAVKLRRA